MARALKEPWSRLASEIFSRMSSGSKFWPQIVVAAVCLGTAAPSFDLLASERKVEQKAIDRHCMDLLKTDPNFRACVEKLVEGLPKLDSKRRELFSERYDPREYVSCRMRVIPNDTACEHFILRRKEWPEYWPDPKRARPKWPDAPKESVHWPLMPAKKYWEALCKAEAGEFVYKTVKGVEGFLMIRPRAAESDYAERDKYVIEDGYGYLELGYPGRDLRPGTHYLRRSRDTFLFVESGHTTPQGGLARFRHEIVIDKLRPKLLEDPKTSWTEEQFSRISDIDQFTSRYGVTWRGIHRPHDRESGISGGELAVVDLQTGEILALRRGFALKAGRSWLSSYGCPHMQRKSQTLTAFVRKVLEPKGI